MLRILTTALGSAIVACGGDAGPQLARPVIDTLPSGVVTVHNTGPAGWADTSGWRLVETARIVASDSGDQASDRPVARMAPRAFGPRAINVPERPRGLDVRSRRVGVDGQEEEHLVRGLCRAGEARAHGRHRAALFLVSGYIIN